MLAKEQTELAPVIIITNESLKGPILKKLISTKKCAVIDLFGNNLSVLEANKIILQLFNKKNDCGMWNCFLINED
jgi:hypothetical protein